MNDKDEFEYTYSFSAKVRLKGDGMYDGNYNYSVSTHEATMSEAIIACIHFLSGIGFSVDTRDQDQMAAEIMEILQGSDK